jgi:hypothetical protein
MDEPEAAAGKSTLRAVYPSVSRPSPRHLDQSPPCLTSVRRRLCNTPPKQRALLVPAMRADFDRAHDKVHCTHACLPSPLAALSNALNRIASTPRAADLPPAQYTSRWLPCIRFRVLFTLISKFFASFAHATYLLSVSRCVFSFR